VTSDVDAPVGVIHGPDEAVVDKPVRYTVEATDGPGGSGIAPDSFAWTRDGSPAGVGPQLELSFPHSGPFGLEVAFRDLAGNGGVARTTVWVAPKPEDRPQPAATPAPPPKLARRGGRYVLPIKGGYRLPPSVPARLGCKGEVVLTIKRARVLMTARATKLDGTCRYSKRVTVARRKVGGTKALGLTVRFSGNGWLAPVKQTYRLAVPR